MVHSFNIDSPSVIFRKPFLKSHRPLPELLAFGGWNGIQFSKSVHPCSSRLLFAVENLSFHIAMPLPLFKIGALPLIS